MQLIDALEERTDSIQLIESVETVEVSYNDGWTLTLDGGAYVLVEDALDTLLNLLRIPIKYIKRCTEDDGKFLAEQSIQYWLEKYGDLSYLVEQGEDAMYITQVFPGKRLYIPGVKVNDLIFEYLEGDVEVYAYSQHDDVFSAIYLTNNTVEIDGRTYSEGVRVLYSDCFSITPRFDGILVDRDADTLFAYPTTKRKFRVAGSTIPQVFEQIEEFIDLSLEGLRMRVVPALQKIAENDTQAVTFDFVSLLCAQLRLSKKIENEILAWFADIENGTMTFEYHSEISLLKILTTIAANTFIPNEAFDVEVARDIQIALSTYITEGNFK